MSWIWRAIGRVVQPGVRQSRAASDHVVQRDTLRMDAALSYCSDLTLREQRERLNAAGPYEWIDRDSHWYPDYISTRCYPDFGFFKIFDQVDDRFNLTIKLDTDRDIVQAELERLLKLARVAVLPVVSATDIQDVEPYE